MLPSTWSRDAFKSGRKKNAPRKKPDHVRAKPQPQRHSFIVGRKSGPDRALEMFVDEVGPEESVSAHAGQNVPGRSHQQKNTDTRNQMQVTPPLPRSRGGDKQKENCCWKNDADQPAG